GEGLRRLARRAARDRGAAGRGHHRGPADGAQARRAAIALRGTTMSIERSQSSTQPDPTRDVARDKADTRPREPAPREKVDDFQRLLQGKREQRGQQLPKQAEDGRQPQQAMRREGQQAPTRQQEDAAIAGHRQATERYDDDPMSRHHRDDAGGSQLQQTLDPAALYQAQMAMRDGLPQATTPTPLNP